MNVLLVSHNIVKGDGQGRVNYELARYLANQAAQLTLVSDQLDEELARHPNIQWHRVKADKRLPNLIRGLLWAEAARPFLEAQHQQFDIVHYNGAVAAGPHDLNTCHFVHSSFREYLQKESSPGLRGIYHRLYTELNAYQERQSYREARHVVAVSAKTAQELQELGVPKAKMSVIYNGVDVDLFQPDASRKATLRNQLAIPTEVLALLYVGDYVQSRKGLGTILEALHGLPDNIQLYVAGKGILDPYRALLAGIEHRVHFLGFRRDIPDLFRAVDCFVFPTRYDSCCLVVLEALASGLAVVTTLASGSGELITPGENGLVLADPYDTVGLRAYLGRLYQNPDLLASLGKKARYLAEQQSWAHMARQYEALYQQLTAQKKAQPGANRA